LARGNGMPGDEAAAVLREAARLRADVLGEAV
jgi:hypothetical protein